MLVKVKRYRKGKSSEAHITNNHLNAHVFTGHMLPSVIFSKIILYLLYNFLKTLIQTYSIPDSDFKKKRDILVPLLQGTYLLKGRSYRDNCQEVPIINKEGRLKLKQVVVPSMLREGS